jgi:SAM-dependent methyltransferase
MDSSSAISSYDLVPYESYPIVHLHPARMAATAQLRGMKPPPVAKARLLDLGCGSGGHVIALAGFYPQMQLIGIDLAAGQIEKGNQRIDELGLTNVSLHAGNLGEGLPKSAIEAAQAFGGQFDYIICQGVYYVVSDTVRSAIWQVFLRHLAPNGIAHISFNTYPGWKLREVAQDFAQFHVDGSDQPPSAAQEQAVREGLQLVAALAPRFTDGITAGYGFNLQAEAGAAAIAIPGLLYHEFLSGDNRPLYFHEMQAQAQQAGFAYLCETSLPDAWPGRFGVEAQNLIAMAGGDSLRLEQYIDFATARTHRNSLWVAPAIASALPSALQAWPVQGLLGLHLAVDLGEGFSAVLGLCAFVSAEGKSFTVPQQHSGFLRTLLRTSSSPLWQSASALLGVYPESAAVLHECVLHGLINAWLEPPDLSYLRPMEAPAWLRKEATRSASVYLPSIWHQAVKLTNEERQFIAQLDGFRLPPEGELQTADQVSLQRLKQLGWLNSEI